MAPTPELAASYARKSTLDDMGLQAQHLANRQKAAADGRTIPDDAAFHFEDDDTSGRRTSREDLDRLIRLITSGDVPFKYLYIKDKTREGRFSDPRFHFFLQVLFEQHGVQILYSDRDVQLDFKNGDPREMWAPFMRDVLESFASAEEVRKLVTRVTEGTRTWVIRGFFPGRPPYGLERWYADERSGEVLERVDEKAVVRRPGHRYKLRYKQGHEREVIQRIFASLAGGASLATTAKALTADGVPSPSGANLWYPEVVRKIAQNPIYSGVLVWGRTTRLGDPAPVADARVSGAEAILVPGFVPDPPVSQDLFEEVATAFRGNLDTYERRRRSARYYPLVGLVVCGGCGRSWHGHTSTADFPTRRSWYRHGQLRGGQRPCETSTTYIRAEVLHDAVEGLIRELLIDRQLEAVTQEALASLIKSIHSGDDHARRAQDLRKTRAQEERTLEALVHDRASAATPAERDACQRAIDRANSLLATLSRQIASHENALATATRAEEQIGTLSERAGRLLTLYESALPAERKRVYKALIRRIEVDPRSPTPTVTIILAPFSAQVDGSGSENLQGGVA